MHLVYSLEVVESKVLEQLDRVKVTRQDQCPFQEGFLLSHPNTLVPDIVHPKTASKVMMKECKRTFTKKELKKDELDYDVKISRTNN